MGEVVRLEVAKLVPEDAVHVGLGQDQRHVAAHPALLSFEAPTTGVELGGPPGQGVVVAGARDRQTYEQRHPEQVPVVQVLAELQRIARECAPRVIAHVDLQHQPGKAEVGPDQRVGNVQRREVHLATAEVLRPGLIEGDQQRSRGVECAGQLQRPGGQPDLLLFGQRQHVGRVDAAGTLPEVDPAAIATDGRLDELRGERHQAVEVVLIQGEPIGEAPLVESQEWPGAEHKSLGLAPLDLFVGGVPAIVSLAGFDFPPDERHVCRAERLDGLLGRLLVQQRQSQIGAPEAAQLLRRGSPNLEQLLGIGSGQQVGGIDGQPDGLLGQLDRLPRAMVNHGGLREKPERFGHGVVDPLGNAQTVHLPLGQLLADLPDLAPGQLQGQIVRFGSLHQRGRRQSHLPVTLDRPRDMERARVGSGPLQEEFPVRAADMDLPRNPVKARQVRLLDRLVADAIGRRDESHQTHQDRFLSKPTVWGVPGGQMGRRRHPARKARSLLEGREVAMCCKSLPLSGRFLHTESTGVRASVQAGVGPLATALPTCYILGR